MTRRSARKARKWGLPPAFTSYKVDATVRIPMRDGAALAATHWMPDLPAGAPLPPLVVTRTPYGRRLLADEAMLLAERGYQVMVVSCRGTFDSDGTRTLLAQEPGDGQDTLTWVAEQPFFPGRAMTMGGSYVGMTQWAVAGDPPPWLRGHAMSVTTSELRDGVIYPEGFLALETLLSWLWALDTQEDPEWRKWMAFLFTVRRDLRTASATLPVRESLPAMVGHEITEFTEWIEAEAASSPYWGRLGHYDFPVDGMRPVVMTSGWFDLFLTGQLRDVARFQKAGVPFRIEIGPWNHSSLGLHRATIHLWLRFFEEHLKPVDASPLELGERPIRVHVGGSSDVLDLAQWPPPSSPTQLHLRPNGHLSEPAAAPDSATAVPTVGRYRFDPADPTPSLGGRTLNPFRAGSKKQRRKERRDDVLVFTGVRVDEDFTIVGEARATLRVRPSHDHVDYVVTLCDVDRRGRSRNVSDGAVRLSPDSIARGEDGWAEVEIPFAPTAHRFAKGHAVRLHVCSAAHPIRAVNLGTGEPLATGIRVVPSEHEVDLGGASSLTLPTFTPLALEK